VVLVEATHIARVVCFEGIRSGRCWRHVADLLLPGVARSEVGSLLGSGTLFAVLLEEYRVFDLLSHMI
jgi:hypothetical protein